MNWLKTGTVALGVLISVLAASPEANATVIAPSERTGFSEGTTLLNASQGVASKTISTSVGENRVIDGKVQVDLTGIRHWYLRRNDQNSRLARNEAADAWTFTLSHAGTTTTLDALPDGTPDQWLKTNAFDGVAAGGDWVLTATSDYYHAPKRMVEFKLAGFFYSKNAPTTSSSSSGGGQVPVPAPLLLILAGLAGIVGTRRRA